MDAKHATELLLALARDRESKDVKLYGRLPHKWEEKPPVFPEPVLAHACILSSQSSHLKDMIKAERKTEYYLELVDHDALTAIVGYMYTRELPEGNDELRFHRIKNGAERLGMDKLAKECSFRAGSFSFYDCIDILLYFVENGIRPAYESVAQTLMRFFAVQMPEILQEEKFMKLGDVAAKSIYDMVQNSCGAEIRQIEFDKARSSNIEIVIKTLCNKTFKLKCKTASTVWYVKVLIQDREGIPPDQQRLIYAAQILSDDQLLSHHKVGQGSTISLVLKLRGCLCSCSADKAEELWEDLEKTGKTNAFDHVVS